MFKLCSCAGAAAVAAKTLKIIIQLLLFLTKSHFQLNLRSREANSKASRANPVGNTKPSLVAEQILWMPMVNSSQEHFLRWRRLALIHLVLSELCIQIAMEKNCIVLTLGPIHLFVRNHVIAKGRNLRDLEILIEIETATPTGNLIVTQVYDVGELRAVKRCEKATASVLPPEVANDCGVSVLLTKIQVAGYNVPQHVCITHVND